jgi:predicted outer membrane repeat protein
MSRRQRDRKAKQLRHRGKGRVAVGAAVALGAACVPVAANAEPVTVSNDHDTGSGSLNQAIQDANADPGVTDINFSGVSGSINLTTVLPDITTPVNINGPGAGTLTINAPAGKRIFNVNIPKANKNAPVNISGLTLSGGNPSGDDGGAIAAKYADLTVSHSVISGNQANNGGAIATITASTTVRYSTIDNNMTNIASARGGAFVTTLGYLTVSRSEVTNNHAPGASAVGGAVASGLAFTTLNDSLFEGNDAKTAGGAVAIQSSLGSAINNSTFFDNHSTSDRGGAIYGQTQQGAANPWLTIDSATIAHNDASTGGGGIQIYGTSGSSGDPNSVPPVIRNTIISNNSSTSGAADIGLGGHVDPASTAFTLIQTPPAAGVINESVAGSNILGVDPNLGGLANNGGPTRTLALNSGSPAIDKGSTGLTSDQRGSTRPSDFPSIPNSSAAGANGADMGAFEALFVPPPPPVIPSIPAPTFGKLATGGVKVGSNSVSIVLTCASANCDGLLNLFTTEKLNGNQVVGLAKKKRNKRLKVGSKAYHLTAGQKKRITVKVNSKGKKLLKKFKRLPVRLAVTQKQANGKSVTIKNVRRTIKVKKKRK